MADQLRALVPGWVEWLGPTLFVVGSAGILALLPWAPLRSARRRLDPEQHWTEQARLVHMARMSIVVALATVPAGLWLLSTVTVGPVAFLPPWLLGGVGVVGAILVVGRSAFRLEGEVLSQPIAGWGFFLKGFLVRLAPLAAILGLGLAAPDRLSSPWTVLWLAAAVAVALALRFQLELQVYAGLAIPADERARAIVARAAARAAADMPEVFIILYHRPNAYAFPWRGAIAFTSRALSELSDDELESVALHELGHLGESGPSSLLRQVLQFIWIPVAALKPIIGSWGPAGLLAVGLLLLTALITTRRFATRMESSADRHTVAHLDGSPAYATALEKIYRLGYLPAVLRHPNHGQLHERIEAAGGRVDYEPPEPPSLRGPAVSAAAALAVGLTLFLAPYGTTVGADLLSPTPAHVALALGGYGSWPYERLGQLADVASDYPTAEVFYAAAVESSENADAFVSLVYVRSVQGKCAEAEAAVTGLRQAGAGAGDISLAVEWVDWCRDQWDG